MQLRVVNADNNEIIGKIAVKLNTLRDQQKHDEWFDLLDLENRMTRQRVRLNLQWLYSRVRYMGDIVRKWDDHIKMQEEDRVDFESDMAELRSPFALLRNAYSPKPVQLLTELQQPAADNEEGLKKAAPQVTDINAASVIYTNAKRKISPPRNLIEIVDSGIYPHQTIANMVMIGYFTFACGLHILRPDQLDVLLRFGLPRILFRLQFLDYTSWLISWNG